MESNNFLNNLIIDIYFLTLYSILLIPMKRSEFLRVTTLTSTLIFFSPISSCDNNQKLNQPAALPLTLAHLISSENISKIGNIYRGLYIGENQSYLEGILINNRNLSNEEIIHFIQDKINEDYLNNEVVIIDGWVISRTEAQQCALYSLIN